MEIVIHYPNTEQSKAALKQKVAQEHVQLIENYIQNLPCPKIQKLQLLKAIQETFKSNLTT